MLSRTGFANTKSTSARFELFIARSRWLFPAVIAFFCVFEYRLFASQRGTMSFVVIELICYLALLVYLADTIIYPDMPGKQFSSLNLGVKSLWYYFLWIGCVSFAGLLAAGPYSLARFKDFSPSIVVLLAVIFWANDSKSIRAVLAGYALAVLFNVALAILQSHFNWPYINDVGFTALAKMDFDGGVVRTGLAVGMYGHPNGLAMLLVPSVILCSGILLSATFSARSKWLAFLFILASIYALIHTYSKGSLSWAAWGCALLLFQRIVPIRNFWFYFLAMLLTVAGLVAFGLLKAHDISGLGTMMGRWVHWTATIHVFLAHPQVLLFGNGSDYLLGTSLLYSHLSYAYPNSHNAYLNQVLLYGLPALFLWFGGVMSILWSSARKMRGREDSFESAMLPAVIVSSLALMGEYFFEPYVEGVTFQAQLFLLLGLAVKLASFCKVDSSSQHAS